MENKTERRIFWNEYANLNEHIFHYIINFKIQIWKSSAIK